MQGRAQQDGGGEAGLPPLSGYGPPWLTGARALPQDSKRFGRNIRQAMLDIAELFDVPAKKAAK